MAPLSELCGEVDASVGFRAFEVERDCAGAARRCLLCTTGEKVLLDAAEVSVMEEFDTSACESTFLFCDECKSSVGPSEALSVFGADMSLVVDFLLRIKARVAVLSLEVEVFVSSESVRGCIAELSVFGDNIERFKAGFHGEESIATLPILRASISTSSSSSPSSTSLLESSRNDATALLADRLALTRVGARSGTGSLCFFPLLFVALPPALRRFLAGDAFPPGVDVDTGTPAPIFRCTFGDDVVDTRESSISAPLAGTL